MQKLGCNKKACLLRPKICLNSTKMVDIYLSLFVAGQQVQGDESGHHQRPQLQGCSAMLLNVVLAWFRHIAAA